MEPVNPLTSQIPNNISSNRALEFAQQIFNKKIYNKNSFLTTVREIFPEVAMYKGEVFGSTDGAAGDKERMRTEMSLLCLYWFMNEDYASFTECQKPFENNTGPYRTLSRLKFHMVCRNFRNLLSTPDLVHAMLVTMAIHDLGKCLWFADAVRGVTNHLTNDHDVIIHEALLHCPHLLPSFQSLSAENKKLIRDAWETGLNTGQFMRGECLPYNLVKAREKRRENPQCVGFFFCHELLDFAGIKGHIEQRGSATSTEFYMKHFNDAWEALSTRDNAIEAYEQYLHDRGPCFDIDDHDRQRAAQRLICLAGLDGYFHIFVNDITEIILQKSPYLIEELNVTGLNGKKGILINNAAQFLENMMDFLDPYQGLNYGLKIFEKVYIKARELEENTPGNGVITVDVQPLCEAALKQQVSYEVAIDPKTKCVTFVGS